MPNVKCILAEQGGKGGGSSNFSIQKMVITTPPTVTSYLSGDKFNRTGMVITGTYGADGIAFDTMTADVTENVSVSPEVLTDGVTEVELSLLAADGKKVIVKQPVIVYAKLTSLTTSAPSIEYEYSDTFPSTYEVTANFSDGSAQTVMATCGNTALTAVGAHNITLSYTDNTLRATTVTATLEIDVQRKSIAKPVLKDGVELTFTGSDYDILAYLDNYVSSYYTVANNTASAAGPHTTQFTPTANYRWDDTKTYDTYTLNWNIASLLIEAPTADSLNFTFNGSLQGPTFSYDIANVTMTGDTDKKSDADTYTVTFTLNDPDSTAWKGGGGNSPKVITWIINKLVLAVPSTANSSFVYNGNLQIPIFTPSSTFITTDGDNTGKSGAGNYVTTFTLTDTLNVEWSDGTTGQKSVSWSITRAIISVKPEPVSKTYNGSEQTATWNNYNSTQLTISGTTKGTNAGSYNATFTPTANYQWAASISANTTAALAITWTIAKQSVTPTVSKTSIAFNTSSTSTTFTVGCGNDAGFTYTVTTNNNAVASVSKNGNTITVTADGKTAGSATITVVYTASANYTLSVATKTVSVSAAYWSWDQSATASFDENKAWWDGLKSQVANMTAQERQNMVGKEQKVFLNTAVLGMTAGCSLDVVCIGADQDGTGTLTFQTKGTLYTATVFGSSALWNGSTAQTQCNNFANACSANAAMKSVTKLTSSSCNNQRTNAADVETTAKCWLPSEQEMGLNSYSPSAQECTKGCTAHMGYSYYDSNAKRIKYRLNANGTTTTSTTYYWERSRYYYTTYSNIVCVVNYNGNANGSSNDGSGYYLAPAFVIG